ncbi:hypothetical protein BX600DRAFT_452012 [Xylariales sp. PMI_506]|nr:hypothetical protein BX600DRAFT_452012 [Xylariales sp. PMI_506]
MSPRYLPYLLALAGIAKAGSIIFFDSTDCSGLGVILAASDNSGCQAFIPGTGAPNSAATLGTTGSWAPECTFTFYSDAGCQNVLHNYDSTTGSGNCLGFSSPAGSVNIVCSPASVVPKRSSIAPKTPMAGLLGSSVGISSNSSLARRFGTFASPFGTFPFEQAQDMLAGFVVGGNQVFLTDVVEETVNGITDAQRQALGLGLPQYVEQLTQTWYEPALTENLNPDWADTVQISVNGAAFLFSIAITPIEGFEASDVVGAMGPAVFTSMLTELIESIILSGGFLGISSDNYHFDVSLVNPDDVDELFTIGSIVVGIV